MQIVEQEIVIPKAFEALFERSYRNIVYYGGRSGGKSRAVAESLIIRGQTETLRILCTREVQNTIRDSVHKLLKDLIEKYDITDYTVYKDSIVNERTGTEFIFRGLKHNINEIKSTEGIDICWVEEAQSISEDSLKVLTPTIRKPGSQIIFTFNRFNELDPVYVRYVMNTPPNTYVKKVNYDVLEKLGLLPDVIIDEIENDKQYPALFAHKWLGEPVSQADMAIVSREAILAAMERDIEADGVEEVGVDVARLGNDRTVFWKRKGLKTTGLEVHGQKRTTEVCDLLEAFVNFDKKVLLKIDDTGVGGGVTDEMIKREYNVMAINFGGEPVDKDKYPNWISEAWFYVAEIMDKVDLPMESDLLMELSTRQWKQDIKGKRRVESKGDYKKRGFRSPDLADAFIICYYTPQYPVTTWASASDMA